MSGAGKLISPSRVMTKRQDSWWGRNDSLSEVYHWTIEDVADEPCPGLSKIGLKHPPN